MDNYHVVGDPELAPPILSTSVDASEVSYNSETVEDALDKSFMDKSNSSSEPADMNDIVSIGTHTINPSVTTLNVPIRGTWGFVEVFKHGTSIVQLWVEANNSFMFTRTKSGNPAVWSSWKRYEPELLVRFDDLPKYGIATSGEKINATLQEICKKVPAFCEVKIHWTGNDTNRFGTLASQIPANYGSLYIHKNGNSNPCVIEFIPYASSYHYVRNFDYINSEHLSVWANISDLSSKQDKTDNSLATSSKTVTGAINELKRISDLRPFQLHGYAPNNNADWANLNGIYTVDPSTTGTPNYYGILVVFAMKNTGFDGSNWIFQLFFPTGEANIYTRMSINATDGGAWSSWVTLR